MRSTRNCIQYLVIIFNRKESEQENIYMHIYLNHFGVNLKYCISTIFQLKLKKKSDGLNDTLNKTIGRVSEMEHRLNLSETSTDI